VRKTQKERTLCGLAASQARPATLSRILSTTAPTLFRSQPQIRSHQIRRPEPGSAPDREDAHARRPHEEARDHPQPQPPLHHQVLAAELLSDELVHGDVAAWVYGVGARLVREGVCEGAFHLKTMGWQVARWTDAVSDLFPSPVLPPPRSHIPP